MADFDFIKDVFNLSEDIKYNFGCYGFENRNGIFYIGSTSPPNNLYERIFGFKTEIYYNNSNVYRIRGHAVDFKKTLELIINNNLRYNISKHNGNTHKHYCLDYRLNALTMKPNWDGFINWYKTNLIFDTIYNNQKVNVVLLKNGNASKEMETKLIDKYKPVSNIEFSKYFDIKYDKHDEACHLFIDKIKRNCSFKDIDYPKENFFTL